MKYSKGVILVFVILGITLILLTTTAIILTKLLIKAKPTLENQHHEPINKTSLNAICGRRPAISSRIVGGKNSKTGEWPWQVDLEIGTLVCGASIISNRWLISAAHCFQQSQANPSVWKAYMGSIIVGQGTSRNIRKIIVHPDYDHPISFNNDIALLELSSPLTFNDFIQPICLPSSSDVIAVGQRCVITGWGSLIFGGSLPTILQKAKVNIVDFNKCKRIFGTLVNDKMLCAGTLRGGVDACQGDSGGPLVCHRPNKTWFLAGIVSFGIECATPNIPGVYTRITALRDWVQKEIGL
ncbi:transmembrane protease serine 11C-like [Scyliorhinus canicula]|uniref:transmembrane protease serine 11C-like n=1 Tax=Scyliorhinus canicula TaxID=7830 RepID=UPI0018F5F7FB|nr:transmembrane protease serine 11C-like [Scyliorhinus canicula]XP_038660372.1 transmembrane protease serine 11C-like [Scyliorhinus canicula]